MNINLLMLKYELDYLEKARNRITENAFLSIFELIFRAYTKKINQMNDEILGVNFPTSAELETIIQRKLKVEFPFEVTDKISSILSTLYQQASKEKSSVFGIDAFFGEKDLRSIEWLKEYTNFWIKNFYDDHAKRIVSETIREGLEHFKTIPQIAEDIKKKFTEQVGDVPLKPQQYWEGVARNAVTRARVTADIRTIGSVTRYYVIDATEDSRTCDICATLDGRVIPVEDGERSIELFESLKSPDDVKKKYPWVKSKSEVLKPVGKLKASHKLPPFHFNCRCVVNSWDGVEPVILNNFPKIDFFEDEQVAEICVNHEKFMNALNDRDLERYANYIPKVWHNKETTIRFDEIGENALGYYTFKNHEIVIKKNIFRLKQFETALHETLHSYAHLALNLDPDIMGKEHEIQITAISRYLMHSINKDFHYYSSYPNEVFRALVGFRSFSNNGNVGDFIKLLVKGLKDKDEYLRMTNLVYNYMYEAEKVLSDREFVQKLYRLTKSKKYRKYCEKVEAFGKKWNIEESLVHDVWYLHSATPEQLMDIIIRGEPPVGILVDYIMYNGTFP